MAEETISCENSDLKEYMLKEIDLIQDRIKVVSSNSFKVKEWTITIVVGTLLLKGDDTKLILAYVPLISFWYLDAYYLWQELKYVKLYKWVLENRLKTTEHFLDLDNSRFSSQVISVDRIIFSKSLVHFYVPIFLLLSAYEIFIFLKVHL